MHQFGAPDGWETPPVGHYNCIEDYGIEELDRCVEILSTSTKTGTPTTVAGTSAGQRTGIWEQCRKPFENIAKLILGI